MVISPKPTLIIIPGLGDHIARYRPLAVLWSFLGYDVRIFSFGWKNEQENFQIALERLLKYLGNFPSQVNIIGISAGGSAAINAIYLRPEKVDKVVTVAAAFKYISRLTNQKLKDSIENLSTIDNSNTHHNILSLHGFYDQKVPIDSTKHLNTKQMAIPMVGHRCIIFIALTVYARRIRRFLLGDN